MADEFITRAFKTRNAAHLEHWTTKSGFHHTVLGDFYEQLIDKLDALVEARAALFGMPEKQPEAFEQPVTRALLADVQWMAEHRDEIARKVPALENALDEINTLYLSTITKLERFK